MAEPAAESSADAPAEPPGRFRSLRELRDEHNRLLSAYRRDRQAALHEVAGFLQRGRASGELLDLADERSTAQSMLDYWSTTVFRQTGALPDTGLADFDPAAQGDLAGSECPYPGVEPFAEAQHRLFFGRESWVDALQARLEHGGRAGLMGGPGVGKTSLIAAGLLPRLRAQGLACLPVVSPGTRPLASLVSSLTPDGSPSAEASATLVGRADGLLEILDRLPGPTVLVIDGLEELFTVAESREERAAFLRSLLPVVEADSRHRVVLSAATDALTGSVEAERVHRWLGDHAPQVEGRRHLGPLGAADLTRAIKSPAEQVGLRFEEGLAGALTRDYLGEPLAFLQLALVRLWEAPRAGNWLLREAYLNLGPGRQLVQRTADDAVADLEEPQQDVVRRIFLFLMPAGLVAGTVKARPATWNTLTAAECGGSEEVLEVLQRHRLVRRIHRAAGGDLVEAIHPALAPTWPRLRQWIHERELREAQERAEEARERADREAALRKRATWFAVLFAAATLVAALGWWRANQEGERNYVLSLVKDGLTASFVDRQPDEGLALVASALRRGGPDPTVEAALLATAYNSAAVRRLGPAPGTLNPPGMTAVGLTGTNGRALAAAQDGSLVLWDLDRGVPLRSFAADKSGRRGHGDEVRALAVSPDGATALSGAEDGTLVLWDVAQGRPRAVLRGNDSPPVRAVAISADGRWGLSVDRDRELALWDVATGAMVGEPKSGPHGRQVKALAFAPSGRHLLTGSQDGTIGVWELPGFTPVGTLETAAPGSQVDEDTNRDVLSVAVSPDSCRALSGRGKAVVLWDIAAVTGRTDCADFGEPNGYRIYAVHEDVVRAVDFSADGIWALSGGEDRRIVLWRLEQGQRLEEHQSFLGHSSRVTGLELAAYPLNREIGSFFVSSSQDGSVRVWDLAGGAELRRYGDLGVNDVHAAALLSDRAGAVLASSQGTALRLDLATGGTAELASFASSDAPLAISPDATHLVHGESAAHGLGVVDLRSDARLRLLGQQEPAAAVAFSDQGQHAVSGDLGGTLTVWDLSGAGETREPIARFSTADLFAKEAVEARQIKAVALRAEAKLAVAGYERGRAFLWHLESGTTGKLGKTGKLTELFGHNDRVRSVAFRPGHAQFATGSRDQKVILWDDQGNPIREFLGHENEVRAIVFTADGRLMVSGGENGQVLLWHVDGGRLIARLSGHRARVMTLAVDNKGDRVLSGDDDGTLIEWGLIPIGADVMASVRSRRYIPAGDPKPERRWQWWRLWR